MAVAFKKNSPPEGEEKNLADALEEKTRELKMVSDELASFSYSISHDLRAPLRGVLGFSKILLEEYGDKLEGQAKEYLNLICDSGQKMNDLIDGLLDLSRVTRGEMRREDFSLSELVESVLLDLQKDTADDRVSFNIEKGIVANGDRRLLISVIIHLMSNALKATSKVSPARIEFGCLSSVDKPVYFVRDNGVGFDMRFADKLFGAFQKLHSENDFRGVGIGLAITQKIIQRHGGRIWVEAAVDQGATFYFTL